MHRATMALLAALLATGCVTTKSANLDDKTVMVSAQGAAVDTMAEVYKAALVKAATIAQQRGEECFQVIGSGDGSVTGYTQGPGTLINAGGGVLMAVPGRVGAYRQPAVDLTVRLGGSCDQQGAWNTRSVLAQAGQK